jgi:hypothetical protein
MQEKKKDTPVNASQLNRGLEEINQGKSHTQAMPIRSYPSAKAIAIDSARKPILNHLKGISEMQHVGIARKWR